MNAYLLATIHILCMLMRTYNVHMIICVCELCKEIEKKLRSFCAL